MEEVGRQATSSAAAIFVALLSAILFNVAVGEVIVMTTLRPHDYASQIGVDVSQYRFVHNVVDLCESKAHPVRLVIVVCSSVENFQRRQVVRQTWADRQRQSETGLRLVFVLGHAIGNESFADSNESVEDRVANEWNQYGDIVQFDDFVDTYGNLSRKSLAALHWVSLHAHCARHVIKADDDAFLNTRLLVPDLASSVHRKFVMGNAIAAARPVRESDRKWATPLSAYQRSTYPTYASGAAYVISVDAVDEILAVARRTPFFWIEDVYVTGMLARAAGLQMIVNGKFDGYRDLPPFEADRCTIRRHAVWHRVGEREIRKLWSIVTDNTLDCTPKTFVTREE